METGTRNGDGGAVPEAGKGLLREKGYTEVEGNELKSPGCLVRRERN